MLIALDSLSVLIYGVLIMVFFLDIKLNKKNLLLIVGYVLLIGVLQFGFYYVYGLKFIEKIYPLLIHLPLVIFFCCLFKKRINLVLFVLFTAYILTAPRKWIGEVIASFYNNDLHVLIVTKMIVSVMLLVVIYKYLRPYVKRISKYSTIRITILTMVPAVSYCITYATTVYTDALYNSYMLVVGIFSVGFNCLFYFFIIAYFIEMDKSFASQTEQTILQMQIDTISIQIEDYKEAQKQGVIYRHDLHHHLQYLSACIAENHTEEALDYITKINRAVESTLVRQYCENTSVNLILSAYATKAENSNIDIEIDAVVPMESSMNFIDMCVILANGMENAINACNKLEIEGNRKISVRCKFQNRKLMIEIYNNFEGEIRFEGDIPISTEKNHGLGVKSIVATVKKYQGVYSFSEDEDIFTMRIIL